jgi:hypothetical protein
MTSRDVLIPNLLADVVNQEISGSFKVQIGENDVGPGRRIYPNTATATIHGVETRAS